MGAPRPVVTSSARLPVSGWLKDDVPQRAGFSSVGMRTGSPVCPAAQPPSHRIASRRISIHPSHSIALFSLSYDTGVCVSFLFLQQVLVA